MGEMGGEATFGASNQLALNYYSDLSINGSYNSCVGFKEK